jgi:hypothetical protein
MSGTGPPEHDDKATPRLVPSVSCKLDAKNCVVQLLQPAAAGCISADMQQHGDQLQKQHSAQVSHAKFNT